MCLCVLLCSLGLCECPDNYIQLSVRPVELQGGMEGKSLRCERKEKEASGGEDEILLKE